MQIYKLCGADCQGATSFSGLAGIQQRGRNTARGICNPSVQQRANRENAGVSYVNNINLLTVF